MKTADEIKKGLATCSKGWQYCRECPYYTTGCDRMLCGDASKYIEKLESEVNEALAYIQKLEPERDALIYDIEEYCAECALCKHYTQGPYETPCNNCRHMHTDAVVSMWEWRGVQKTENRHAQVGDYVKIVKVTSPVKRFRVGGIYKVVQLETEWNIPGAVNLDCGGYYASPQEYEVLEGYKTEEDDEC